VHISAVTLPPGCQPTDTRHDFTIATIAPPVALVETPAPAAAAAATPEGAAAAAGAPAAPGAAAPAAAAPAAAPAEPKGKGKK
jgi:large subunit ribosomal protein L25